MGKGLFQAGAVGHDGIGQVSQVPVSKKGEGECAELFCKANPAVGTLFIGARICFGVFLPMEQKDEHKNDQCAKGVSPHTRRGIGPFCQSSNHGL